MGSPHDLAPWASDVRVKNGKLHVTLRRGLDLSGVLNLLKIADVRRIRSLRVPGSVGLSGLRALVASGRLPSLTSLAINGFADADDAVDVVFEAEAMKQLRVLKVWGVSDALDSRLARGEHIDALQQLDIRQSPELTSLDRFFESKRVASLKFLTVNRAGLTDATSLLDNASARHLRTLSLASCEFSAETVDGLVGSPYLDELRGLNLSHCRDDDAIDAIPKVLYAGSLRKLESLALCGCEIEGVDWERVDFPELRRLDLRENPMSLDELQEVLEAPGLASLEQLVASTPEGFVPADLDRRLVIDDRIPPWA